MNPQDTCKCFLTDLARINHSQTRGKECKRWSAFTNCKGSAVADHRLFGIFSMGVPYCIYVRIACLRHSATSSHIPTHTSRKCYLEGGPSTLFWVLSPREACLGAMTAASQMPKARSSFQFQVLKCCMCQDCSRLLWLIISCLDHRTTGSEPSLSPFVHGPVSGSRFEPYCCEGYRAADTSDAGQQPLSLGCIWPAGKMIIAMIMAAICCYGWNLLIMVYHCSDESHQDCVSVQHCFLYSIRNWSHWSHHCSWMGTGDGGNII